jgi:hypothetical protein
MPWNFVDRGSGALETLGNAGLSNRALDLNRTELDDRSDLPALIRPTELRKTPAESANAACEKVHFEPGGLGLLAQLALSACVS